MATKYSFDEPTNREDLSDVITKLWADDTPITSMCGKTKATGTKHEFPEDELAAAKANAQVEGADITAAAATSRTRKSNHTQIIMNSFSVTGTQQAVKTAGVADEYAYAQFKAQKACALDLEYALTNNVTDAAGTKTTAATMAGVPGCITTNVLANGGTARKIDGTLIANALQEAWAAGGEPKKLIVSGTNKRVISAMVTSNTKNVDAKKKELVESIDVFESDFGRIEIVASRFMPDTSVYLLDPQYLKLATLRPFKAQDLPKTGDSKAGYVLGELTLECRGEKGQAIIKDLKTA